MHSTNPHLQHHIITPLQYVDNVNITNTFMWHYSQKPHSKNYHPGYESLVAYSTSLGDTTNLEITTLNSKYYYLDQRGYIFLIIAIYIADDSYIFTSTN